MIKHPNKYSELLTNLVKVTCTSKSRKVIFEGYQNFNTRRLQECVEISEGNQKVYLGHLRR